MKKRFALAMVVCIVFFTAISVSALPPKCPYCGQPAGEYETHTTHYETYRVPCSNPNLFGTDLVSVKYDIHRSYCNYCDHINYERWWEQSRTTTCQGWSNPPYTAAPIALD